MKLSDFKALSFDCYGTLIDWETGLLAALKPLVGRVERNIDRREILETYARHESQQELQTPAKLYPKLMATV
ncbi:MAG: haloacid dehalogenase, partial [Planctomycetota bacterium]